MVLTHPLCPVDRLYRRLLRNHLPHSEGHTAAAAAAAAFAAMDGWRVGGPSSPGEQRRLAPFVEAVEGVDRGQEGEGAWGGRRAASEAIQATCCGEGKDVRL